MIVGKDHVDLLVTAFMTIHHSKEARKAQARMGDNYGRGFMVQNLNSWNYCHPEDKRTKVPEYHWDPVTEFVDAWWEHDVIPGHYMVQLLKAVDWYEDQSSEHPEWDESENGIRKICRALRAVCADTCLDKYLDWPKDERPEDGGRLTWRGWNLAAWHWTREHGFREPPKDDFEAIVEYLDPDPWGRV